MLKLYETFQIAFKETAMEYLQNASLNGFHLLYYVRRHKYQRLLWCVFLMAGIICGNYVTLGSVFEILKEPTVTTLESSQYSVQKVPFPSLEICSVNKMSRSAVNAYIEEMRNQTDPPLSQQQWLQKVKLFAGFFDSSSVDFKEVAEFQKTFFNKQKYTVRETIAKLAPKCEDLILKCIWEGKIYECTKLFAMRFTPNGYCCTSEFHDQLKSRGGDTMLQGLSLLLNTSTDDYFVTDRSFAGFTLQIFNLGDFPDASLGGSVQESFIPRGSDVELRASAFIQTATSELSIYSVNQRYCLFYGEVIHGGNVKYSRDVCMTRCKSRGTLQLCGCIPYYTPLRVFKKNTTPVEYCTLADLECLEQHRVTLNTYSLLGPATDQPVSWQSLDCPNCLPVCEYNSYSFHKLVSRLSDAFLIPLNMKILKLIDKERKSSDKFNYSYDALEALIKSSDDLSLVKIYFDTLYATQYSKRSLYNWYQMLSNIGGIIGIFIGCSLISAFEIIYFFSFKLIKNIRKHNQITRTSYQ
ncbi:sodium channel protein Nach isoform X2 [Anastrepha ludens]|uniref:sodium channel protein Nach isoform X2 n=2 Tax=Anastrepha ludens TaxID=28586 RepID=UPI0023AEF9DF|nr:sodium channel protein Nach isoform X2 [Anastrepha ludens]